MENWAASFNSGQITFDPLMVQLSSMKACVYKDGDNHPSHQAGQTFDFSTTYSRTEENSNIYNNSFDVYGDQIEMQIPQRNDFEEDHENILMNSLVQADRENTHPFTNAIVSMRSHLNSNNLQSSDAEIGGLGRRPLFNLMPPVSNSKRSQNSDDKLKVKSKCKNI